MAMIARGMGPEATFSDSSGRTRKVGEFSDAELISELGAIAGTDGTGTSMEGMLAMANALGKDAQPSEMWWSNEGEAERIDGNWLDASLRAGKPVVINGAIQPEDADVVFDHYLVVSGKTSKNEYLVNDSWSGKQKAMSADDIAKFLRDNSIHDGLAIQIG